MKKDSAEFILEKAKSGLVLDAPFWASIQLKLKLIEDPIGLIVPTMATDGEHIYYNPAFVQAIGLLKTKGVLAHEDAHVVFLHPYRRGDRDMELWNKACDYAINPIILDAKFELPDGILIDDRFRGMEAEAIYDILKKEQPPQGKDKGKGKGQGPGQPQPGQGQGQDPDQGKGPQVKDPGGCGAVMDVPHSSKEELESKMADKELEVKAAMAAAKSMGKLPGSLDRTLEDLLEPKVDWRSKLHQFYDTYARNDYNWSRPNRRYISQGIYLPSLKSQELGEVTCLMDASGSTVGQMKELVSEAMGILDQYENATLHVIFFDTVAGDPIDIDASYDVSKLKIGYGGGTDYRPPFEKVNTSGLCPTVIVVLTDGECNRFPESAPAPVLWVLSQKNRDFKPPFGDTIVMPRYENGDDDD